MLVGRSWASFTSEDALALYQASAQLFPSLVCPFAAYIFEKQISILLMSSLAKSWISYCIMIFFLWKLSWSVLENNIREWMFKVNIIFLMMLDYLVNCFLFWTKVASFTCCWDIEKLTLYLKKVSPTHPRMWLIWSLWLS